MANYYEYIHGEIASARVQRDRAFALLIFVAWDAVARHAIGAVTRAFRAIRISDARTDG
jgi:hypothetical protein